MKFHPAYPSISILQHPLTTEKQRQDTVASAKPASGSDVESEKETASPMSKANTDNAQSYPVKSLPGLLIPFGAPHLHSSHL